MSDNPFANQPSEIPPPAYEAAPESTQKMRNPSGLTFIFIVALLLGLLGILSNVLVIASPFVTEFMNGIAGDQNMTEEMTQARDELAAIAAEGYIPNLIFVGMNFIVAGLLIVGAISGLSRKPSTPKILSIAFLMGIVLVVLRTVYGLIFQIKDKDRVLELSIIQAGPQGEAARGLMEPIFWITLAITVMFSLGLVLFYAIGWFRMRNKNVVAYFQSAK